MNRRGQSTVEWALAVAVMCVAVVAAAYAFVPEFGKAMAGAREGMAGVYTSGDLAE